ncbi:hypothetical protein KPH14_008258 [Odynerus spinipes]|uniref:HAP1 N-terminal domain-containing protein n=1 Tax=Odynerus spinipes TaxID=1348599 RepID=A0AAD9VLY0_9HYME|nr:hypothetical protein KPH14_008258 [Odynerus spinipes]
MKTGKSASVRTTPLAGDRGGFPSGNQKFDTTSRGPPRDLIKMLLRGIAFAEVRRNSARRVFKGRDKAQNSSCEKEGNELSLSSNDASLMRQARRTIFLQSNDDQPNLGVVPIVSEGEAISLIATASKLAAVEDVGPKRPEGQARPSVTSLKVSPTARATLQALRTNRNRIAATTPPSTKDAETITEVCSGGELPEVEIISLLEEQIPRYRLRADTLTEFQGYENADWFIPSPALKTEDIDLKLSPDQIRETLNYFRK